MPGILYVVATPIGNLEDVTLRALRVLREVSLIAAEDTRRTARLLQHYSIRTPTTSLHEHNERAKTPTLIDRLERGESVAIVSDAGTPVLSDPGAMLISAAHHAGIKVEPVPGANAAVAALSASGIGSDGFVFVGFPPSRSSARKRWLSDLVAQARPIVMFEAPHRIRSLLADLHAAFGDRNVTIARELTKIHEELVNRPISEHLEQIESPRGEFTVVVHPSGPRSEPQTLDVDDRSLLSEFGEMTNNGQFNRRQAVKALAEKYQVTSRELYRRLESAKN
jgi:16S rRNA (cytidine1402-2'-O)-methyltransferase